MILISDVFVNYIKDLHLEDVEQTLNNECLKSKRRQLILSLHFKPGQTRARIFILLKVHKIEIFFGFNFEICIISLLFMSKY